MVGVTKGGLGVDRHRGMGRNGVTTSFPSLIGYVTKKAEILAQAGLAIACLGFL